MVKKPRFVDDKSEGELPARNILKRRIEDTEDFDDNSRMLGFGLKKWIM